MNPLTDCVFGRLSVYPAADGFESDSLPGGLPSISSMSSVFIALAAIRATKSSYYFLS